jgi:hypothetical protein
MARIVAVVMSLSTVILAIGAAAGSGCSGELGGGGGRGGAGGSDKGGGAGQGGTTGTGGAGGVGGIAGGGAAGGAGPTGGGGAGGAGAVGGAGGAGAVGGSAGRGGSGGAGVGGAGAGGVGGAAGSTGGAGPGGAGAGGVGGAGGTSGGGGGASDGGMGLLDRITVSDVAVPEGVQAGGNNSRVWGSGSLGVAPVFTAPSVGCGTLVCFTSGAASAQTARVVQLDKDDKLVNTFSLGAYQCRGLAAEGDGHFAALLWQPGASSDCKDYTQNGRIYVKRFDAAGVEISITELLNNTTDPNCPTNWGLGESRFAFGGGSYAAYYHVHSATGHEGDTYKTVDLTGKETTKWAWGCSHSMSNVLRYNPAATKFLSACVTDCYPGTSGSDFATTSKGGLYTENRNKVLDIDAGCNGNVAGELGGIALAPSGWKMVFNAHQAPMTLGQSSYNKTTMNQDIGFANIGSNALSTGVVWLTTTPGNEADSTIAAWKPSGDSTEQYVVGWLDGAVYRLGRVDATGMFLEGPLDATAKAKWGRRDDPMREHVNGDIVWSWFGKSGDTVLHFARMHSGVQCP